MQSASTRLRRPRTVPAWAGRFYDVGTEFGGTRSPETLEKVVALYHSLFELSLEKAVL